MFVRRLLLAVIILTGLIAYRVGRGMHFQEAFAAEDIGDAIFISSASAGGSVSVVEIEDDARTRWDKMTDQLGKAAAKFPGRMGIYLKDLNSGLEWTYHADEIYPSASLVKLPIMISLCKKISDGEIKLDEELVLSRNKKRGGSGRLRWLRNGTKLTVRQLMEKMIIDSDNTATRMLIDDLGFDYLQSQFTAIGLEKTNISEEGMSLATTGVKKENYTTPREMAMMLEKIYRGEMIDKEYSDLMLDILKRTRHRTRFVKVLPKNWELAHKTGMLRYSCHDAGIFFSPKGDYVLTVLTWKSPDYHYAANYIGRMAQITFGYYGDKPQVKLVQRVTRRRHHRRSA